MKDLANMFIVCFACGASFLMLLTWVSDVEWGFDKSPQTGICYETQDAFWGLGKSFAMSPVDDSFCEEALP